MTPPYAAGTRLRITQQLPHLGNGGPTFSTTVEGTVVGYQQQKTGSWFAHSRDHKLWVDRLRLRKDDGELVTLNLDQYSVIDVLDATPAKAD